MSFRQQPISNDRQDGKPVVMTDSSFDTTRGRGRTQSILPPIQPIQPKSPQNQSQNGQNGQNGQNQGQNGQNSNFSSSSTIDSSTGSSILGLTTNSLPKNDKQPSIMKVESIIETIEGEDEENYDPPPLTPSHNTPKNTNNTNNNAISGPLGANNNNTTSNGQNSTSAGQAEQNSPPSSLLSSAEQNSQNPEFQSSSSSQLNVTSLVYSSPPTTGFRRPNAPNQPPKSSFFKRAFSRFSTMKQQESSQDNGYYDNNGDEYQNTGQNGQNMGQNNGQNRNMASRFSLDAPPPAAPSTGTTDIMSNNNNKDNEQDCIPQTKASRKQNPPMVHQNGQNNGQNGQNSPNLMKSTSLSGRNRGASTSTDIIRIARVYIDPDLIGSSPQTQNNCQNNGQNGQNNGQKNSSSSFLMNNNGNGNNIGSDTSIMNRRISYTTGQPLRPIPLCLTCSFRPSGDDFSDRETILHSILAKLQLSTEGMSNTNANSSGGSAGLLNQNGDNNTGSTIVGTPGSSNTTTGSTTTGGSIDLGPSGAQNITKNSGTQNNNQNNSQNGGVEVVGGKDFLTFLNNSQNGLNNDGNGSGIDLSYGLPSGGNGKVEENDSIVASYDEKPVSIPKKQGFLSRQFSLAKLNLTSKNNNNNQNDQNNNDQNDTSGQNGLNGGDSGQNNGQNGQNNGQNGQNGQNMGQSRVTLAPITRRQFDPSQFVLVPYNSADNQSDHSSLVTGSPTQRSGGGGISGSGYGNSQNADQNNGQNAGQNQRQNKNINNKENNNENLEIFRRMSISKNGFILEYSLISIEKSRSEMCFTTDADEDEFFNTGRHHHQGAILEEEGEEEEDDSLPPPPYPHDGSSSNRGSTISIPPPPPAGEDEGPFLGKEDGKGSSSEQGSFGLKDGKDDGKGSSSSLGVKQGQGRINYNDDDLSSNGTVPPPPPPDWEQTQHQSPEQGKEGKGEGVQNNREFSTSTSSISTSLSTFDTTRQERADTTRHLATRVAPFTTISGVREDYIQTPTINSIKNTQNEAIIKKK